MAKKSHRRDTDCQKAADGLDAPETIESASGPGHCYRFAAHTSSHIVVTPADSAMAVRRTTEVFVDAEEALLLAALKEKVGHYGKLEMPFVIAIDALDYAVVKYTMANVLFGRGNAWWNTVDDRFRWEKPRVSRMIVRRAQSIHG